MRNASDPEVLARTQGLISYIRYLIKSDDTPGRHLGGRESVVWLADLPDAAAGPSSDADGQVIALEYFHPRPHPRIPEVLRGWLDESTLADPTHLDPELAGEGPAPHSQSLHGREQGNARLNVPRSEAPEVVHTYQEWLPGYQDWARHELAARPYREVHSKIREMASRVALSDDRYEVVLAAGLLDREDPRSRRIARHLITRRLSIVLEPDARLVIALDGNSPVRLEDREFLDEGDGYSADRSPGIRDELDDQDLDPLGEDTWALLQRWAELSFAHAVHCDPEWERRAAPAGSMTLTLAPAIILRERSGDALARYYEHIADSLSAPGALAPLGLAQLVAPLDRGERLGWSGDDRRTGAGPGEQLLPKATNEAQRRVLERMTSDTAVVVQGPPGTGKTHTIANLTCALLAEGLRVLVTSQREEALRELRDKLPALVKDLCITFTGTRRDGTDDFSRSITAMSELLGSTTPAEEEDIIRDSARRRDSLVLEAERLRSEIVRLREAEWTEHADVAPGLSGTLGQIASRVTTLAPRLEWLSQFSPGCPAPVGDPPLSMEEAQEFRTLLAKETDKRRARRAQRFPGLEAIPETETLQRLLSAMHRADDLARRASGTARALAGLSDRTLSMTEGRVRAAVAATRRLGLPMKATDWPDGNWQARALRGMLAGQDRDLWRDIDASAREIEDARRRLAGLGQRQVSAPELSGEELTAMLCAVSDLRRSLPGSGRLRPPFVASREQRAARRLLGPCLVDGHAPSDASDIDAVLSWLRAAVTVSTHMPRWESLGIRPQRGVPVHVLVNDLGILHRRLRELDSIASAHDAIVAVLADQGVQPPGIGTMAGWDTLCEDIAAGRTLATALQDRAAPGRLANRLPPPEAADPPELTDLRSAARAGDIIRYQHARESLEEALAEWRDQQRCDDLAGRLGHWHPQLTAELARTAQDPAWEERLRSLPEASAWLTARGYCENAHALGHDRDLHSRLDEAELHIAEETERLAAARARLHLLRRITQEQRQAIETYRAAVTAVGKGKGRYATGKRQAARSAMRVAMGAVPAWIMPVAKVAENVPPVQDAFDVVIVDEASQSGLDALFLLWLAPRVIAVGDDRQCAPGWPSQDNQKYLDQLSVCLPDLAAHERLGLEPGSNLYALLLQRFPEPVRLTEHFRSMPEIIAWSSRQFYDDRLIPYRQFSPNRLPPLRVVHIDDGRTEGREQGIRNDPEAKHLVEKLRELPDDPAYSSPPRSFSIIALQGSAQAKRIRQMVDASIEPTLIARHSIRVGDPPAFQGAESDVVMLSMVVTRALTARTGLREQRRFNVAATRARDQLWLFTSVTRDQLKPEDLRFSLLTYMEDPPSYLGDSPSADEVSADIRQPPFESLFQQRLFRVIRQRGYHVVPQFPVSRHYRIDLVVSGSNGRLAVECDGPVPQATTARIRRDMDWERDLRRADWKFWRVRESEFILAPEQTLEALWSELADHGIFPDATIITAGTTSSSWSPISLRAEEDDVANDDERQDQARQ